MSDRVLRLAGKTRANGRFRAKTGSLPPIRYRQEVFHERCSSIVDLDRLEGRAVTCAAGPATLPRMPVAFADILAEARLAARALVEFGRHWFDPTVRLGVTGLSRSGKTVFITALVHGLMHGGRFPVFEPAAAGRIARARLAPQPDDAVPRFDYEAHLRALVEERRWPESTDRISELRLVVDYQSQRGAARRLTIDIVDYPGEWLLDLPLLAKSYQQWSAESLALSREGPRTKLAAPWHAHLTTLDAED